MSGCCDAFEVSVVFMGRSLAKLRFKVLFLDVVLKAFASKALCPGQNDLLEFVFRNPYFRGYMRC